MSNLIRAESYKKKLVSRVEVKYQITLKNYRIREVLRYILEGNVVDVRAKKIRQSGT